MTCHKHEVLEGGRVAFLCGRKNSPHLRCSTVAFKPINHECRDSGRGDRSLGLQGAICWASPRGSRPRISFGFGRRSQDSSHVPPRPASTPRASDVRFEVGVSFHLEYYSNSTVYPTSFPSRSEGRKWVVHLFRTTLAQRFSIVQRSILPHVRL